MIFKERLKKKVYIWKHLEKQQPFKKDSRQFLNFVYYEAIVLDQKLVHDSALLIFVKLDDLIFNLLHTEFLFIIFLVNS